MRVSRNIRGAAIVGLIASIGALLAPLTQLIGMLSSCGKSTKKPASSAKPMQTKAPVSAAERTDTTAGQQLQQGTDGQKQQPPPPAPAKQQEASADQPPAPEAPMQLAEESSSAAAAPQPQASAAAPAPVYGPFKPAAWSPPSDYVPGGKREGPPAGEVWRVAWKERDTTVTRDIEPGATITRLVPPGYRQAAPPPPSRSRDADGNDFFHWGPTNWFWVRNPDGTRFPMSPGSRITRITKP